MIHSTTTWNFPTTQMSSGEQRSDQSVLRRSFSSSLQPSRERRRDTTLSLRSADRISRRNEKRQIPTLQRRHSSASGGAHQDTEDADSWTSSFTAADASDSEEDVWDSSFEDGEAKKRAQQPSDAEIRGVIDALRSASAASSSSSTSSSKDALTPLRRLDHWLSGRRLSSVHNIYRVAGAGLVRALRECIQPLDHEDSERLGLQAQCTSLAVRCVAHLSLGSPEETELLRPVLPGLKLVLDDALKVETGSPLFAIFDAAAHSASALANLSLESHAVKRLLADNHVVATLQRVFLRMTDTHNSADEPLWRRFTADRSFDNPNVSPLDPISNVISCTAFALSTFFQRSPDTFVGGTGGEDEQAVFVPVDSDEVLFRSCQSTLTAIVARYGQQLSDCPPDLEPQLGNLLSELLWLSVYTCSRLPPPTTNRLLEDKADKLVRLFAAITRIDVLGADVQIPALRTLGNLLNACDSIVFRQVFGKLGSQLLEVLVLCLRREHRVVIKEAGWLLRCLAQRSIDAEQFETIVDSTELLELVTQRFKLGVDVRQEFALFVLLLMKRKAFLPMIKQHCLEPFLQLLKAHDPQICMMALEFTELCLALPGGPKAVELAEGIDALEYLQHHTPDPGLARFVGDLVDRHYGENCD